jgi:hypothetical protein
LKWPDLDPIALKIVTEEIVSLIYITLRRHAKRNIGLEDLQTTAESQRYLRKFGVVLDRGWIFQKHGRYNVEGFPSFLKILQLLLS